MHTEVTMLFTHVCDICKLSLILSKNKILSEASFFVCFCFFTSRVFIVTCGYESHQLEKIEGNV